jgi:activator of HSP90 ATPase
MIDKLNRALLTGMPTRRQAIAGTSIALAGLALSSGAAWSGSREEISRTDESIHQEPFFTANRKRLFDALTDTNQFDKVTKLGAAMNSGTPPGTAPTKISREVGGTFSLFGGHILGRHIELAPNQRIVQAWRVNNWPAGLYSIARFELIEQGSGAKIVFDHAGFPKGDADHLAEGWKGNYWEPLKKFLT